MRLMSWAGGTAMMAAVAAGYFAAAVVHRGDPAACIHVCDVSGGELSDYPPGRPAPPDPPGGPPRQAPHGPGDRGRPRQGPARQAASRRAPISGRAEVAEGIVSPPICTGRAAPGGRAARFVSVLRPTYNGGDD